MAKEYACDRYDFCPYGATSTSSCRYWCNYGEEDDDDELDVNYYDHDEDELSEPLNQ